MDFLAGVVEISVRDEEGLLFVIVALVIFLGRVCVNAIVVAGKLSGVNCKGFPSRYRDMDMIYRWSMGARYVFDKSLTFPYAVNVLLGSGL